ncbi:MAG TPA: hypothetical protein VHY19_14715 [Steroidobacteraceae bacterium]|nr:hypothetical protein [Steroidobacteraceae bacterium]
MIGPLRAGRAAAGACLFCLSLLVLSGCAHHRANDVSCRRPEFNLAAQSLPALRAPSGLNTPNTANGIHVPALNQPAPVRAHTAPCLDWPPTYVSEPPVPPTRRSSQS